MLGHKDVKEIPKAKDFNLSKVVRTYRDKEKEDALNARIAAIRSRNKIIEQRHREVEADRLEAERNNASVTLVMKKRTKTNSMSSSTDSEIADLFVSQKDDGCRDR